MVVDSKYRGSLPDCLLDGGLRDKFTGGGEEAEHRNGLAVRGGR